MGLKMTWWVVVLVSLSASIFISDSVAVADADGVFEIGSQSQRKLLQTKKECPINFENQNYTILTSQCKGPPYSAELCCSAYKKLSCPFAEEINDLSNNCADRMFTYIYLHDYPRGLFASLCREGKEGLSCPDSSSDPALSDKASGSSTMSISPFIAVFVLAVSVSL